MYVVNRKEIFFAINLIPVSLYALIIVSHFLDDFYGQVQTSNKKWDNSARFAQLQQAETLTRQLYFVI